MPTELKTDCKSLDAELDKQFGGQSQPLSPQARQHLDECERCRKLYQYLAETPPAAAVSPEVQRRIVERAQKSLEPVSQLRSISVLAGQLLIVFCSLGRSRQQHDEGCGHRGHEYGPVNRD